MKDTSLGVFPLSLKSQQRHVLLPGPGTERAEEAQVCGLLAVASAGGGAPKPGCGRTGLRLWLSWAAGSGIWNSPDTDVAATLGSQPGLWLSLIPIFGCRSHLIHIPMSTLHNLPQTLTAWELGERKGQLMSRDRGMQGGGSGGEQEVGSPQKLPAGSTSLFPPP